MSMRLTGRKWQAARRKATRSLAQISDEEDRKLTQAAAADPDNPIIDDPIFERMRPAVAFYAGFFPRYSRLMAESGFPEAAQAIRTAWQKGDREGAAKLVPDELIQALGIAGTPTECRERIEAYRRAGIALPIIFPLGGGPDGKQRVMDALRACAP